MRPGADREEGEMIDHDLLTRAIAYGLDDGFESLNQKAEAIGEAFGRGFRRANPPAGLVGRRCRWTILGVTRTGTIRHVSDDPSEGNVMLLVEHRGALLWCGDAESVALLPWLDDEQSDEVTP